MMSRSEVIDCVKQLRKVKINLYSAKVKYVAFNDHTRMLSGMPMSSRPLRSVYRTRTLRYRKIIVHDDRLGAIYFSSSSDKFNDLKPGDLITLSLTVTGVGTASTRYPEPILFAKANTRAKDSVTICKPE